MTKEDERFGLLLDALRSQQVINKATAERIQQLENAVLELTRMLGELAKAVK